MSGKSITKNSLYNIVYKGLSVLFPLVTTTYTSHILKASGTGTVDYARTIVNYFIVIAALGIPQYGVRVIAQNNNTTRSRTKSFLELFSINCVSTVICIAAYYIMINCFSHFQSNVVLHNIMGIMLILNIFGIDWFYQGIEEYGYITVRSLIIKIISLILMFLFVKSKDDYVIYGFITCIAIAGNNILNVFHIRKYIKPERMHLELRKHLKPVMVLLASAMATEIYTMLDTVLIESFYGVTYVGYYSNPVKMVRAVYSVSTAAIVVFYPRISLFLKEKRYDESNKLINKGFKYLLIFALPSTAGIFVISRYIVVYMFGNSFLPSIATLRILSSLVIVFSVAYFLGHIILLAVGKETDIFKATVVGAVTNFILNMILIPLLKHNGAAIASVTAEIAVTVMLIRSSKEYFKLKISKTYIKSLVISLTVMIGSGALLTWVLPFGMSSMIVIVTSSVLVYFLCLLIMKNEVILDLYNMLKNKFRRDPS